MRLLGIEAAVPPPNPCAAAGPGPQHRIGRHRAARGAGGAVRPSAFGDAGRGEPLRSVRSDLVLPNPRRDTGNRGVQLYDEARVVAMSTTK
jgi:hypothetical protein